MRKSTSFFIGLIMMAGIFLPLPKLSYASNTNQSLHRVRPYAENQVVVSVMVSEHITYYGDGENITVQTNLKNETVVVRQNNEIFVTVKP